MLDNNNTYAPNFTSNIKPKWDSDITDQAAQEHYTPCSHGYVPLHLCTFNNKQQQKTFTESCLNFKKSETSLTIFGCLHEASAISTLCSFSLLEKKKKKWKLLFGCRLIYVVGKSYVVIKRTFDVPLWLDNCISWLGTRELSGRTVDGLRG